MAKVVTSEIERQLPELHEVKIGLCNLFIKHTSASLSINENCDPDVRDDMEKAFNRIVPESWNRDMFKHTMEGDDDMPAHVKSTVIGASINVPITKGKFNLGTWQGIYLCEHRNTGGFGGGHERKIVGDLDSIHHICNISRFCNDCDPNIPETFNYYLQRMAEGEDNECCPLCMEELDITDKTFNSCACGYQVCLWCWHQIKNEYNGLCPACRKPYLEAPKKTQVRLDREESLNTKTKVKKQKEKVERRAVVAMSKTPPTVSNRALADIRVMQRNLVYVIGLPEHYADEEKLRSQELFGQYGRIIKAVVNKSHLNLDRQHTTVSAYITFAEKEDALSCIHVVDGYLLDGSPLRASFGTTKYCNFFLRNAQCTNTECLYLHELGDENDSFTKEEMHAVLHAGRGTFREGTASGISLTESRAGSSLPPPVNRSISRESSPVPAIERTRNSVGSFRADGTGLVTANAQRKAQSAAAITKLKRSHQERLVFRAVSKNATSPSRKRAQPYSAITAGVTTPSPERIPANDAGTHGLSNGCSDQNISPTERRKRVTDYHPTKTAWNRPFSAGFIMPKADPDDLNAPSMATAFGPLEQGTHTLLPSEIEQTTWKPPTIDTTSSLLRPPSAPLSDFSTSSTLTSASVETPCTTSSFASIDAIFSQRNESSEALASLLGVKLCPRPLHHGSSTEPINTVRTSRFAFANQPSKTVTGFPSSTLEQENTLVDRKFESLGHRPLHVPSHYLCGENTSTLDASTYRNTETSQNSHSQNSFENCNPDSGRDDGLAYLQSMLPNVNISFGGEYSGAAAPGAFMGNSMMSQSPQSDRTLQNNVWADRPNRAELTAPFHDPAIVIPDPAARKFHSVRSSSRQSRTH